MLQRGTAILLMFCVLSANFARLFVFAGFELNQKYIASTLCENRDKPWLHCNGRCYLMKKIKQAQEKEKSNEQQTQKNLFQEAEFTTVKKIRFSSQLLQVFPERCRNMYPRIIPLNLLRPPQEFV